MPTDCTQGGLTHHLLQEPTRLGATWYPQKKQTGEREVLSIRCSSWDTKFLLTRPLDFRGYQQKRSANDLQGARSSLLHPKAETHSLFCPPLGPVMWLTGKLQWLSQKQTQTKERQEAVVLQNSQTKTMQLSHESLLEELGPSFPALAVRVCTASPPLPPWIPFQAGSGSAGVLSGSDIQGTLWLLGAPRGAQRPEGAWNGEEALSTGRACGDLAPGRVKIHFAQCWN